MSDHDRLLWAIAESPADDAPRLVYSDYLEEHGDAARAEFVRVQCELASPKLKDKRRYELRVRERELLTAHRAAWCAAIGLPLEDVVFRRGLLAAARLPEWDAAMLDPAHAARLATLEELDLSGTKLGNAGLTAFAKQAQLPALRKLMLNNTGVSGDGVTTLAAGATGLPRLDTVYLFGNRIAEAALTALKESKGFRLTNLDVGERPDGYVMTPGEAEMARRDAVRGQMLPLVANYFARYERLQSAALCVAQYWADEADDAVHGVLLVSELFEPSLACNGYDDAKKDPNLPTTHIPAQYGDGSSSVIHFWGSGVHWDDNSGAIPLWAAYAPEEGHQEYAQYSEVYAPAVLFYRHGGYEFLPLRRPQLDGVRPEYEE